MIPRIISFQYHRTDIDSPNTHNVSCKIDFISKPVKLKDLVPSKVNNYLMFVCVIYSDDYFDNILSCIKTEKNIIEEDIIPENCYLCSYLIPIRYPVISSSLTVEDEFNIHQKFIFNVPFIFNDETLNLISLPKGTIKYN